MRTSPLTLPSSKRVVVLRQPTLGDIEDVGLDDTAALQQRILVSVDSQPPPKDWTPNRRDAGALDHIIFEHLIGTDATVDALARQATDDNGEEIRIPAASSIEGAADADPLFRGFSKVLVLRHPTSAESNAAHAKAAELFPGRSLLAGEIRLIRTVAVRIETRAPDGKVTSQAVTYSDLFRAWPFSVPDSLLMVAIFREATNPTAADVAALGNGFALVADTS